MSRHRGRPRPLAARRFLFPRHCACAWHPYGDRFKFVSFFDIHTARTVAPR